MTSNPIKLIDPMDFSTNRLLKNLQGNILKGHGRDHTTHIFLRFKLAEAAAVRERLIEITGEHLTSFKHQLGERERFKRNGVKGGLFMSVYFTAAGLMQLGYDDVGLRFTDPAFLAGMKHRQHLLSDPDV